MGVNCVDWLKRMNAAIDLMEQKMDETLDIEEIAKVAYSSPFHFQRMFHMLTGMTISEYTRKRKLTLAAHELASTSAKVMDVAMKYGYDSPESFTKAFRKIHGVAPSKVRQSDVQLKAFPRISLQISIKGTQELEYRIVEKEAFAVVGKSIRLTCGNDSRLPFWQECRRDSTIEELNSIGLEESLLGITMDIKDSEFTYMIAKKRSNIASTKNLSAITVPATTWAIFSSNGPLPNSIQSLFKRIYQEWFPDTGYEHSGGPEIEVYLPGDSAAENYHCEVWIPVVKSR